MGSKPEVKKRSNKQQYELFRGKDGPNNRRIMVLLSQKHLTKYQINTELGHEGGKQYSTVFDRVKFLEAEGIIKKVGQTKATTSPKMLDLYGLDNRGLYVAIFYSNNKNLRANALHTCGERFSKAWELFARLYNFRSDGYAARAQELITSDAVLKATLRYFGYAILQSEEQLLLTFRRMIDLGIMMRQEILTSPKHFVLLFESMLEPAPDARRRVGWEADEDFGECLNRMAELAYHHPTLKKVCLAIEEADRPLIAEMCRRFIIEELEEEEATEIAE
jgi:hypothetical protein